jgi:hypothetical protein
MTSHSAITLQDSLSDSARIANEVAARRSDRNTSPEISHPASWIGGGIAITIITAYMLLIHNRYFPIQDGGLAWYARLMQQGKLPYKDFYFYTQPLSLFISEALLHLSDKIIFARYYGIFERIVLFSLLYYMLSRRFSMMASTIGTLTSSIVFMTYYPDVFFSYLYTSLVFLMAAAASLQTAYILPAKRSSFLFLAGTFASLSFFAKQSNGLLGCMAIALSTILLTQNLRRVCRDLLLELCGGLLAAAPFIAWIQMNNLWKPYLTQVFIGAASSKGTLLTILFGFLPRLVEPLTTNTLIFLGIVAAALIYDKRLSVIGSPSEGKSKNRALTVYALTAVILIFVPFTFRLSPRQAFYFINIVMYFVRMNAYMLLSLLCLLSWHRVFRSNVKPLGGETTVILAIVGLFWTFGCAASASIEHQSVIPSMAILLAFAYDRVWVVKARVMHFLVLALSLTLILTSVIQKYTVAFTWMGWREQVAQNSATSRWEPFGGYRAERQTIEVYDTILDDIATHSGSTDTIFTFPVMTMFNYASGRLQPTFSQGHYWDVCPDWVAEEDANRLATAKPRLIINMDIPEDIWRYHEDVFRMHHRSGQRKIQEVIDRFISSGDYELLHEFDAPFFTYPIYVWWRKQ